MKSSSLKIAVLYLVAGVCWIIASDTLLAYITKSHLASSPIMTDEMIKGLGYVLITSIMLYFLVYYFFRRLQRSHEDYRSLFEDNPCPMLAFDHNTLKIVAVNNAALHQYGYTEEEFLSMTIDQMRPKEDIPKLLKIIRTGRVNFDKTKISRHITKSGKILSVNVSAQDGFFDHQKVRWAMMRDLTEVVENQKLLKEALERYDLILEATKDIIWDVYLESGRTMLHGAVFENFGYQISSVDIDWFNKIIHPDDLQRFWNHVEKVNQNEGPIWSDQFRIRCADGRYKYVNARGYILYLDDKKPYRSIGIIQVIQKQKEYELKIENQNQLLKEIAHTVSHELRGPVASMKGILSLLEQRKNIHDGEGQEFQYLIRSANKMDDVIHKIMDTANRVYYD